MRITEPSRYRLTRSAEPATGSSRLIDGMSTWPTRSTSLNWAARSAARCSAVAPGAAVPNGARPDGVAVTDGLFGEEHPTTAAATRSTEAVARFATHRRTARTA